MQWTAPTPRNNRQYAATKSSSTSLQRTALYATAGSMQMRCRQNQSAAEYSSRNSRQYSMQLQHHATNRTLLMQQQIHDTCLDAQQLAVHTQLCCKCVPPHSSSALPHASAAAAAAGDTAAAAAAAAAVVTHDNSSFESQLLPQASHWLIWHSKCAALTSFRPCEVLLHKNTVKGWSMKCLCDDSCN